MNKIMTPNGAVAERVTNQSDEVKSGLPMPLVYAEQVVDAEVSFVPPSQELLNSHDINLQTWQDMQERYVGLGFNANSGEGLRKFRLIDWDEEEGKFVLSPYSSESVSQNGHGDVDNDQMKNEEEPIMSDEQLEELGYLFGNKVIMSEKVARMLQRRVEKEMAEHKQQLAQEQGGSDSSEPVDGVDVIVNAIEESFVGAAGAVEEVQHGDVLVLGDTEEQLEKGRNLEEVWSKWGEAQKNIQAKREAIRTLSDGERKGIYSSAEARLDINGTNAGHESRLMAERLVALMNGTVEEDRIETVLEELAVLQNSINRSKEDASGSEENWNQAMDDMAEQFVRFVNKGDMDAMRAMVETDAYLRKSKNSDENRYYDVHGVAHAGEVRRRLLGKEELEDIEALSVEEIAVRYAEIVEGQRLLTTKALAGIDQQDLVLIGQFLIARGESLANDLGGIDINSPEFLEAYKAAAEKFGSQYDDNPTFFVEETMRRLREDENNKDRSKVLDRGSSSQDELPNHEKLNQPEVIEEVSIRLENEEMQLAFEAAVDTGKYDQLLQRLRGELVDQVQSKKFINKINLYIKVAYQRGDSKRVMQSEILLSAANRIYREQIEGELPESIDGLVNQEFELAQKMVDGTATEDEMNQYENLYYLRLAKLNDREGYRVRMKGKSLELFGEDVDFEPNTVAERANEVMGLKIDKQQMEAQLEAMDEAGLDNILHEVDHLWNRFESLEREREEGQSGTEEHNEDEITDFEFLKNESFMKTADNLRSFLHGKISSKTFIERHSILAVAVGGGAILAIVTLMKYFLYMHLELPLKAARASSNM